MSKRPKKIHVTFFMIEGGELHKELLEFIEDEELSRSAAIRRLIRAGLEALEDSERKVERADRTIKRLVEAGIEVELEGKK